MAPAVSVPLPCSARWDQMTPAPSGRHCAACNQVVVDFTTFSEADLAAALRQPGSVCGRFRPAQVPASSGWAPWLLAVAATLSSCEKPAAPTTPEPSTAATAQGSRALVVRGTVVDMNSGQPLGGTLIISEQDTSHHTRTAADGSFRLVLPLALQGSRLVAAVTQWEDRVDELDAGYYVPKYFLAQHEEPTTIHLREQGLMLGRPKLEPGECHPPIIRSYLGRETPPPPPVLSTIKFTPPAPAPDSADSSGE